MSKNKLALLGVLTFSVFISFFVFFSLKSNLAFAETDQERKSRLEAELAQYEAEIREKEAELAKQKQQTGSIQRDVNIQIGRAHV